MRRCLAAPQIVFQATRKEYYRHGLASLLASFLWQRAVHAHSTCGIQIQVHA